MYSMFALIINKATAKMRFNVTGAIFLPILTPSGAQKNEIGTTQMAARTLTRPNVPKGAPAGVEFKLVNSIRMAPGTHTKSETADDVPIDLCGGTEQAFSTGTVSVPPPIPSIDEKHAMQKAIQFCPNLPGNLSKAGLAFALNRVLMEFRIITPPNRIVNHAPPKNFETMIPTKTPTSIATDHALITSISVFPFLFWDLAADIDVGIIHKREVPVAMITATSKGTLKNTVKTKVKQGTKIIPPPTPSKPARKPATTPHKARIAIVSTNSIRGIPKNIFPPFLTIIKTNAIVQKYLLND